MSEISRLGRLPTLQVNGAQIEHSVNFDDFIEGARTISSASVLLPILTTFPFLIKYLESSSLCNGCHEMQNGAREAHRRSGKEDLSGVCGPRVIESNARGIRTGVEIKFVWDGDENNNLTSHGGPCALAQEISGLPQISYKTTNLGETER